MRNASIFFGVTLAICGASTSFGAQAGVSLEKFTRSAESAATFRRLDKNKDGRISFDEWRKFDSTPDAKKHFDSLLSVNEDQITPNGWKYRLPKSGVVVQVFNHMDRDHDGSLAEGTIGNPPLVPQLSITW